MFQLIVFALGVWLELHKFKISSPEDYLEDSRILVCGLTAMIFTFSILSGSETVFFPLYGIVVLLTMWYNIERIKIMWKENKE
jgi:hypothetical protein